jgi:H+/Cl- antiporter ClcA
VTGDSRAHPARALLALAAPAAVIGVGASLLLLVVSELADQLQDVLWDDWPDAMGFDGSSDGWIVFMLTLVGFAVGLAVWKLPGHAGPDPATQSLVSAPLAPAVLPSLVVVTILGLAGGVSLGPENPITAINIALTVAVGGRLLRRVGVPQLVMLAAAGTIGALFGTPVGAALVFSEMPAGPDAPPLFDRLFAPLIAAAAGAVTTTALAQPSFAVPVAPYRGFETVDLLSASVIGVAAAVVALVAVFAFPHAHAAFHRLAHPVAMLTVGGLVLGLLGAIGGTVTLFKGLSEMKDLAASVDDYSNGRLLLIVVVKLVAIVVAATCGFRGGRIFPAVFVGVTIGLLATGLVSAIPPAVAVSAGVLGAVAVVTRDGWLSLFVAAVMVPDVHLLPVLVIAVLPVWLIVTGAPEMLITPKPADQPAGG